MQGGFRRSKIRFPRGVAGGPDAGLGLFRSKEQQPGITRGFLIGSGQLASRPCGPTRVSRIRPGPVRTPARLDDTGPTPNGMMAGFQPRDDATDRLRIRNPCLHMATRSQPSSTAPTGLENLRARPVRGKTTMASPSPENSHTLIDQHVAGIVGPMNQRGILARLDQFKLKTAGLDHRAQRITQCRRQDIG